VLRCAVSSCYLQASSTGVAVAAAYASVGSLPRGFLGDVGDGRPLSQNSERHSPWEEDEDEEEQSPMRRRHLGPLASDNEASGDEGAPWSHGRALRPGGNANGGATVSAAQAVRWPRDDMWDRSLTEPGHVWMCDRPSQHKRTRNATLHARVPTCGCGRRPSTLL
jgi:hypothetical protein